MGTVADLSEQHRPGVAETAQMKAAFHVFRTAVEVAQRDPIAATQLFRAEAAKNPFLGPLKNYVFRRSTDGDAVIVEIKDPKGELLGWLNSTGMLEEARRLTEAKGMPLTD